MVDDIPAPTHYLPGERADPSQLAHTSDRIEREGFINSLLDTIPGLAVAINEQRQIVAAGRQTLEVLGADSVEDVLGMRPGEVLGCDVPKSAPSGCGTGEECKYCGLVNAIVACRETADTVRGECRIAKSNGDALNLDVMATPTQLGDQVIVFIGMRDISAEKRRELLERTFLHDLLNTAGGIHGLADLLTTADIDELGELKAYICETSEALVDEIKSYRQLLEAEEGNLVTELRELSALKLLDALRSLYAGHQVAKGRTIVLEAEDDARLETDPALLRRVIGNMIKNALEATPKGGVVHVGMREERVGIHFHVRNPSVMPERVRRQIFRRSFSTKGAGHGIGTYSIRLFGERYLGGRVSFTSEEPEGTVFTIVVPKTGRQETSTSHAPDVQQAKAESAEPCGAHVLLAEDDAVSREIACKMLERLGCTVVAVENGREALEASERGSFDLALLDMNMPEMGGLEAARVLRARENGGARRMPIVALTGGNVETDGKQCSEAGMDAFLEKPVGTDDMTGVLHRFVVAARAG